MKTPPGQLSPDRRWIASLADPYSPNATIRIYDFKTARLWCVNVGHKINSFGPLELAALEWHPKSHALVVGAAGGWAILWPKQRQIHWLTRVAPDGKCCAAWSPHSGKLAFFEGSSDNGLLRIWNGHRVINFGRWATLGGYPLEYPFGKVQPWQCEWSPDEKKLFFRYGSVEHLSDSAGNIAVLDSNTGQSLFHWADEALPAYWLDNQRLIYDGDIKGSLEDVSNSALCGKLIVAIPSTGQRTVWLVGTPWTLSPRRDMIYAIDENGNLLRTPSKVQHWQVIKRHLISSSNQTVVDLEVSPHGDLVALLTQTRLLIYFTRTHRIRQCEVLGERCGVIGWAEGHRLPLMTFFPPGGGPDETWQLV